jgi:hypothetical protein
LPIAYDAPADLKKWPSLNSERRTDRTPYLVYSGMLADCIRQLLAKPIKQKSLYDIETTPQEIFDLPVLSPADAADRDAQGFSEGLSGALYLKRC